MGKNSWFRSYNSALDNPKIQRLKDADFRGWFNLLCIASAGDGVIADDMPALAFRLRCKEGKARELVQTLLSAGLLERCDAGYAPHDWDEHQYKSDGSTERVKRFRERFRNAHETASETGPETEQIQKQSRAEKAHAPVVLPDWLPPKPWADFVEMRKKLRAPMTDEAKRLAIRKLSELRDAGDDPAAVIEKSILNGWKGLFGLEKTAAQVPGWKPLSILDGETTQ